VLVLLRMSYGTDLDEDVVDVTSFSAPDVVEKKQTKEKVLC
jgi:hypothetical protein